MAEVTWAALRTALVAAGVSGDWPESLGTAQPKAAETVARALAASPRRARPTPAGRRWTTFRWSGRSRAFGDRLRALAAGPEVVAALPGKTVKGSDFVYYEPDAVALGRLLGATPPEKAISVEVQNGSGTVDIAQKVIEVIAPMGYTMLPAKNADGFPDVAATRIFAAPDALADADRLRERVEARHRGQAGDIAGRSHRRGGGQRPACGIASQARSDDVTSDPRTSRYHRQMLFGPMGEEGQKRLAQARVGLVGCGALGSVIASHLVRAGVGFLRVVDRDFLELNNLQRQMLYTEQDVSRRLPKAVAAADHLRAVNSEVVIEPVVADINPFSIVRFADGLDLLVDGTDNFSTRFLINDLAVSRGLPWVYGGVIGASGMTMTIVPGEGPCLRCLFPDVPPPGSTPTCDTAGILNTVVAVVGSLEANEVYKLLVDPEARNRGLLTVDLWDLRFETVPVARDPECPACGRRTFPFLEADEEYATTHVVRPRRYPDRPAHARRAGSREPSPATVGRG